MLAALATASRRHIANAFSRHIGCSPFASLCRRANPDEETTDWRAVCGRTARTVRRAGTAKPFPTPIADLLFLSSIGEHNHESLDGQICGSMPKLCSSCFRYPRSSILDPWSPCLHLLT